MKCSIQKQYQLLVIKGASLQSGRAATKDNVRKPIFSLFQRFRESKQSCGTLKCPLSIW